MTDANGEAYQFLLYLPFGESMVEQKVATFATPYQFNGKELDAETGLYNYGARYYDPSLSLWLGVDPLADQYAGVSPYTYVLNNPIIHTDPDGRSVDGEFEQDANGKWQKVSTKGDDIGVDFYHFDARSSEGVPQRTYLTDRSGNWNVMTGGRDILGGTKRSNDVGYSDITSEFMNGTGPESSLFEGEHPANRAIRDGTFEGKDLDGSLYTEHQEFLNSGLVKDGPIRMSFGLFGIGKAGVNMQKQMMGGYSVSFYRLGDRTLTLATDKKSRWSLYYHIPGTKNFSRSEGVPLMNIGGAFENHGRRTQSKTNTFQTYMFFMK